MIARRKFRTKQARRRERFRVVFKSIAIFFGVLLFFVLCGYLSHYDQLRIQDIHIQTDGLLQTETLAEVVTAELSGKYFGVWPKDSIAVFRHNKIEKTLKEQFPRVAEVKLDRPGLFNISAIVHERSPKALWCGDVVPPIAYRQSSDEEKSNEDLWGTCYLLDEGGYLYAQAPIYSGSLFPRYYGSLEKAEPIAQQFLQKEEFLRWQELYLGLGEEGVKSQALLFVDERDVELYLTNGIKVLVPRQEDVEQIQSRLIALLDSGNIDENKELEYVDLRFGKKAFIKYYSEKLETE